MSGGNSTIKEIRQRGGQAKRAFSNKSICAVESK